MFFWTKKPECFVSYSRKDENKIVPIVHLLRLSGNAVFRDADSIRPGAKWRDAVEKAIRRCRLFLLFWSEHSSASEEVRKEWEYAIRFRKNIVPVLTDDAPLAEPLSEIHAVCITSLFEREDYFDVPERIGSTVNYATAPSPFSPCADATRKILRNVADSQALGQRFSYDETSLLRTQKDLKASFDVVVQDVTDRDGDQSSPWD